MIEVLSCFRSALFKDREFSGFPGFSRKQWLSCFLDQLFEVFIEELELPHLRKVNCSYELHGIEGCFEVILILVSTHLSHEGCLSVLLHSIKHHSLEDLAHHQGVSHLCIAAKHLIERSF